MRFGSTTKVMAKRVPKYYRISQCTWAHDTGPMFTEQCPVDNQDGAKSGRKPAAEMRQRERSGVNLSVVNKWRWRHAFYSRQPFPTTSQDHCRGMLRLQMVQYATWSQQRCKMAHRLQRICVAQCYSAARRVCVHEQQPGRPWRNIPEDTVGVCSQIPSECCASGRPGTVHRCDVNDTHAAALQLNCSKASSRL